MDISVSTAGVLIVWYAVDFTVLRFYKKHWGRISHDRHKLGGWNGSAPRESEDDEDDDDDGGGKLFKCVCV